MTDPRVTPANDRVAHVSLQGIIQAPSYVAGTPQLVSAIVTDLCRTPNGPRDRQLLRGETFHALDKQDGWVFGQAKRDQYVGWIEEAAFVPALPAPTHRICVARTYAKTTSGLKTQGRVTPLPFGSRVTVIGQSDQWSEITWSTGTLSSNRFVPSQHLAPVPSPETDPAAVAERLIGTPYLWGGNSSFGIDCSGLVQAALLACDIPCPGDSDQQAAAFAEIPQGNLARGDLVFWKGHVGMMLDGTRLIHANAHHMSVTIEPLAQAIARISQKEFGDMTGCARPRPSLF
ncbi:peptidoglycan endopeptidase [Aliishimia ponticola]|uniref:Peptidoglycan endopeptidase n=1 Tax=Aliishimia ponticola TaxID=2499833 RepID=A0A4S4NB52_9RHOB|nr:NlpC/P60 family protein [Aliishimia ponticola]THH36592.1 peptidoglycan endopeptidase [Aliishimia ponticola]